MADMTIMHKLAFSLLSALYPSDCPVCKKPSDDIYYAPVCKECWSNIRRYAGPCCRVCATPLVSEYSIICGECLGHPPPFKEVLSFGIYSGALSEAVHLLKFSRLKRLARPLGKLLLELPVPGADGIVPVPVTGRTLRQRGFNQTLLLSRIVSKHFRIPLYMDMLYKRKETLPQIGLGAKERLSNLKGVFGVQGDLTGMSLILLDDVMTTGATAKECSKSLKKAGAKDVTVVTLARSSSL